MFISQVCAAARCCASPGRVSYALTILSILFTTSAAFGATLVVPAGGDLQSAINAAAPGDTIILEAGATYRGPFVLPKKTGDAFITIQSSRSSEITGRVTPAHSGLLAKLRSSIADPIVRLAAGAHHYKLIGLEISTFNATDFIYDLVRLGEPGQSDLASVPHNLVLDRLWIHGFATQDLQRGISLNSAETSIINSYISDIHSVGIETQGICGWNGPGPYHIINNYIEASGINLMFGGSLPSITNLVPSNIQIRRNHFFKPLSWKVGHPTYAGIHWSVKNLMELKNARNVIVDGNVLENSWGDSQIGYAILFTVRSEGGRAPWATVENITFTNNIVKNSEQGFQLLGTDYPYQSGRGNGLMIANNLFTGITNRFLTMTGFYNVTLNHNTHFQNGNVTALYGEPSIGFVYTNNITTKSGYGFFGDGIGEGTAALATYTPGAVFQKNLIAGATPSLYPVNNFYPSSITGVLDSSFRVVNSTYKLAGTDGRDLGCDIDALNAAQGGASSPTSTPTPTPTPTPTSSQESPHNTRVPPATQIVDSNGNVWTRTSTGVILRNGAGTDGTGSQILYCNRIVYVFGTDLQWWRWTGTGWTAVGKVDPCGGESTPTPTPTPTTSSGDVVLWAAEAPVRVGAWSVVADATAAGGKRISNPDAGAAKRIAPLASPTNYFEMSFNAPDNVEYRLWIRGRAQNDFWGNDSVFVQFSDSLNSSGFDVFRIGTTSAAEMNLEDCSGCGLSGWGWQDNGWGVNVLGPLIRFARTGTHTIRIQVREDGLSIDQIVLSPQAFKNSAPGRLKNDATILPK